MTTPESAIEWLVRAVGALVTVLVGWLWTRLTAIDVRVNSLSDKVGGVELTQAKEYVTRAEMNEGFARIESKLDQIASKIDRKADK